MAAEVKISLWRRREVRLFDRGFIKARVDDKLETAGDELAEEHRSSSFLSNSKILIVSWLKI